MRFFFIKVQLQKIENSLYVNKCYLVPKSSRSDKPIANHYYLLLGEEKKQYSEKAL